MHVSIKSSLTDVKVIRPNTFFNSDAHRFHLMILTTYSLLIRQSLFKYKDSFVVEAGHLSF